jgi:hypothetical protein
LELQDNDIRELKVFVAEKINFQIDLLDLGVAASKLHAVKNYL